MLLHPLRNFEVQRYDQNKPRFNGVYQEIIYQEICLLKVYSEGTSKGEAPEIEPFCWLWEGNSHN